MSPPTRWLTVKDAALILGVSEQRVRALIAERRIPATRHGARALAIKQRDLEKYKPLSGPKGGKPRVVTVLERQVEERVQEQVRRAPSLQQLPPEERERIARSATRTRRDTKHPDEVHVVSELPTKPAGAHTPPLAAAGRRRG